MADETAKTGAIVNRMIGPKPCRKHPKFDWLKAPSFFLIVIGVMGILSAKTAYFKSAFSFLDLPSLLYSLLITGLAVILFVISCVCKQLPRGIDKDLLTDNWRSI